MKNYNTDYYYVQLNSKHLLPSPSFQRGIDFARVKSIVAHFNPAKVNPIKVSFRDGRYYVFDGQHTLASLKMRNNNRDLMVDCKVYEGFTLEMEARLFAEQDGLSRAVKANDKMKALYVAKDIEIMEMHDLINATGITFDFSGFKGPNKIIACATIHKIFRNTSRPEFLNILDIVKGAWGGDAESFNKEILGGVYKIVSTYSGQVNKRRAITQFGTLQPHAIIREGKSYQVGGDTRFARPLLAAYNKNLRTGRLDETKL